MTDRRLSRRTVLHAALAAAALPACTRTENAMTPTTSSLSDPKTAAPRRMPVVFAGHGSPMNAIEDNAWSRAFRKLGAELPRPKAVLAVSAHWLMPGTFVTANAQPETIHDFGGFPRALYEVQYPARGDVKLAERIARLVADGRPALRTDWGLDHGTWSVLRHYFPEADVPVLQLSIDVRLPLSGHVALGRSLAPLRDEGVLIVASGNITHNLRAALNAQSHDTPEWARRFDDDVTRALEQRDTPFLERVAVGTEHGRMSHPSIDHYLPLLYAIGASDAADRIDFPITGFDWGSLSMRSVRFS